MKQIYIGDFKIHDLDDPALQYFVKPGIPGLEFPSLRVNSHNLAGQDGIAISSIFLGERRIQITGKVHDVGSEANHVVLRRAFLSAMLPVRDSNGLLVHKTLRFTAMDGLEYQLECEVVNADMVWDQVRHSNFIIDVLGTKGVIESTTLKSVTVSPLTRGGFVLPIVLPITFSAGSGGTATATNDGDTTAYPILTFAGPLTNPRLTNTTTGEFITLTISLTDGEVIVVNTAPDKHTVVQGGVTNRISTVSDDSTYFGLPPGPSTIELTTGVSGETGTATVDWRDANIGV